MSFSIGLMNNISAGFSVVRQKGLFFFLDKLVLSEKRQAYKWSTSVISTTLKCSDKTLFSKPTLGKESSHKSKFQLVDYKRKDDENGGQGIL